MEALGKLMTELSSMHPTHKRLSRRFQLLQALVNGHVLEAARSVVECKQSRAPVQQRIFNVLPRSVAPTVEEGSKCAKTPTTALVRVVVPSGSQNGEKRKRVDDENSIESLSSAPTLMERPRKQLKIALSTTAEVVRLNSPKTGQKRKNVEEEFSVNISKLAATAVERPRKQLKVALYTTAEVVRFNSPKIGRKRKKMEEEFSVNISKSASTAEETANKRVKFDISANTTRTSLDQKLVEVSKKLKEDDSLERAQILSTTTGSTDQLKESESPTAIMGVNLDPAESRKGPAPTTSINTSNAAYATVQRAIEQLKASMPADIDTSASRYLDIETNLWTELLKLLDGIDTDSSIYPSLRELIEEKHQKQGNTEGVTLAPQVLATHGTPAHALESDAIGNQSPSPLMIGNDVAPETCNNKRTRDSTSNEGHPDVQQDGHDMNDASLRNETEQFSEHQSFPSLVIGEWLQDDRPPGSPRVIINGVPPPRKRRSSNARITALAEGSPLQALAPKDHTTEQSSQRVPDSVATRPCETTEANVVDFKARFLHQSEQLRARKAPSEIGTMVPAYKEPKNVDEAIKIWFAAVQRKREVEWRKEAHKKRREAQARQAESQSQKRDSRPVRCSWKLIEAFQTLIQLKRKINNLPVKYGAEVGAKVRLDVSISAMDTATNVSLVDRVI